MSNYLGGNYPGANCPGAIFLEAISRGQLSGGQLSWGAIVLGGNCPGSHCPGVNYWVGGNCPGGNCPRTKNTMETYSSFKKPVSFMCFWLNYCDGNHHIKRIPIAVKNMDHLFCMATEIIEFDVFNLFLLSDGTRIDDNEYLDSLENGTELISVRRNKSRNCQSVLN